MNENVNSEAGSSASLLSLPPLQLERPVLVGWLASCHGVQGGFKAKAADPLADWVNANAPVDVTLWPKSLDLQKQYPHGKAVKLTKSQWLHSLASNPKALLTVKFDHCHDRTQAEAWVGASLWMPYAALPKTNQTDTFRDVDLVGLQVVSQAEMPEPTAKTWGRITALVTGNGQDFVEVHLDGNGALVLIPFVEAFWPTVDVAKGIAVVDKLDDFLVEESTPKPMKAPFVNKRTLHRKAKKEAARLEKETLEKEALEKATSEKTSVTVTLVQESTVLS